jgi:hypothetical protein
MNIHAITLCVITALLITYVMSVQHTDVQAMKTCQLSHSFETCHSAIYN